MSSVMVGIEAILFFIFGAGVLHSNQDQSYEASAVVDAKYFGQHMHHTLHPSNPTPWPEVKFGTWRLWDAYVQWPLLEPVKGEWDFSKLDQYVAMAEQHDVEILLPLGLSPRWASARPDEKSAYMLGNSAEPRDMEDWRNYVRVVATRYKGKIHHYELWNEVNLPMFYTGSPEKLVALAREMSAVLKEVDPSNVVVSASITGDSNNAQDWFSQYLALGGGNYADVIGYHFYVPSQQPEVIPQFVQEIKSIKSKYGYAKLPLWNTESGWRMANTDGTPDTGAPITWLRLQPEEAAAYVARALILGRASGIERYYWYAWDNGFMGSIEPKDKSIKPAGIAYGQVYSWMVGNKLEKCSQKIDLWICSISDAQGSTAHMVWTSGVERTWIPPQSWHTNKVQKLSGQFSELVSSEKIVLTQSPTLYFDSTNSIPPILSLQSDTKGN